MIPSILDSHPLVSMGDWFQNPHGYQNPYTLKSLMYNGVKWQSAVGPQHPQILRLAKSVDVGPTDTGDWLNYT